MLPAGKTPSRKLLNLNFSPVAAEVKFDPLSFELFSTVAIPEPMTLN